MVAHSYNPSTREADLCKFQASLVYKVISRATRAVTKRNPISNNNHKKIPPSFQITSDYKWRNSGDQGVHGRLVRQREYIRQFFMFRCSVETNSICYM